MQLNENDEVLPCKCCGKYPEYLEIARMHYVKCYDCELQFVGLSKKKALEQWNNYNGTQFYNSPTAPARYR